MVSRVFGADFWPAGGGVELTEFASNGCARLKKLLPPSRILLAGKLLYFLEEIFDEQPIEACEFVRGQFNPDVVLAGIVRLEINGSEQRRRAIANVGGHDHVRQWLIQQNNAWFPGMIVRCRAYFHNVNLLSGESPPLHISIGLFPR
ncbi:hypothetical protein MPLA_520006 [Mesorhizobium sp. ORS 3359]|nr:hypothetical protein MPLA_520006 [Mesorhizobium sp. ORS 3359]